MRRGRWSLLPDKPYAPRLKTLARQINEEFSGRFEACVERGYCNTDRKLAGTRLIHQGKGRRGNQLIVIECLTGKVVFKHNAAETYRSNDEVVRWIEQQRKRLLGRRKSGAPR